MLTIAADKLKFQTLARGWHGDKKKPAKPFDKRKPFASSSSSRTEAASSSAGPPWQRPSGNSFFKPQSGQSSGRSNFSSGSGTGGARGGNSQPQRSTDRRPASGGYRKPAHHVRIADSPAEGEYIVSAVFGIGGNKDVLSTTPNVTECTHTYVPPLYLDTASKRDAFQCFDVSAITSGTVPIWIPPSIPIFEDLAEVKDLYCSEVNLLHDVGHDLYIVLDSACAKMCCGTNWLVQASQRLDSLGLSPVQVPTSDPFRFGISTCWSVGRAYIPLSIRGVPITLIPSLIAENPDLSLLASLEFMEAVGLQLDVASKRCNMTKLGLYNIALRKTPQGHLAVNVTGYPVGGFPRDLDS